MEQTLKVTGFSLVPAVRLQLQELFSRVAQVEKVFLSSDRNAAFVRLSCKSSLQFVVDQTWTLGNEQLKVRPAVNICLADTKQEIRPYEQNSADISLQSPDRMRCYNDGRSSFWFDVPHHSFHISSKFKKKKKNAFSHSSISQKQSVRRTKIKPKSKNKKKSSSFNKPGEKNRQVQKPCFKSRVPSSQVQSPKLCFKSSVPSSQVQSPKPCFKSCVPSSKVQSRKLCFKSRVPSSQVQNPKLCFKSCISSSQHHIPKLNYNSCVPTSEKQSTAHLRLGKTVNFFVKGKDLFSVSFHQSESCEQLRKLVAKVVQVPTDLLHLTLEGRCLTSRSMEFLEPGATLHYTVKGKGGMQNEAQNENESDAWNVPRDAITEDVKTWLSMTCGVTNMEPFTYVDGATLFDYKDFKTLMEETGVTYAVAKKIIFLRDFSGEASTIMRWSTSDVIHFIQNSLCQNGSENTAFLSLFSEKSVDGIVLMSFNNAEELKNEIGVPGPIARRIFLEKKKYLEKEKSDSGFVNSKAGSESEQELLEHKHHSSIADEGRTEVKSYLTSEKPSTLLHSTEKLQDSEISMGNGESGTRKDRYIISETDKNKNTSMPSANIVVAHSHQNAGIDASRHESCKDISAQESKPIITQNLVTSSLETSNLPVDKEHDQDIITLEHSDPLKDIKIFITENLHLCPVRVKETDRRNNVKSYLKVFYSKERNELVDSLQFSLLSREDISKGGTSNDTISKLWKLVFPNISKIWWQELSQEKQNKFTVVDGRVYSAATNKEMLYDKANRLLSLSDLKQNGHFDANRTCVLLVDKQVLKENCQGYFFLLGTKKQSYHYDFGFDHQRCYWIYDSSDYAYGFHPEKIPFEKCGSLKQLSFQCKDVPSVHPRMNADKSIINHNIKYQQQEGSFVTLPQLEDKSKEPLSIGNVSPRPFKAGSYSYREGVLDAIECGESGDLLNRAVEFKLLVENLDFKEQVFTFLTKTLEFICGCLNGRKNGTIYVGIADGGSVNGIKYLKGEIVGILLDQNKKDKLYSSFHDFLSNCFDSRAQNCIIGPLFIPVHNTGKFVVEVDIEPSSQQCGHILFHFNAEKLSKHNDYKEFSAKHKKRTKSSVVCIRKASSTLHLEGIQLKHFEITDFPRILTKRQEDEKFWDTHKSVCNPEADKLKNFFSDGVASMYPILIITKPTSEIKSAGLEVLKFVKHIPWIAVFDFDPNAGIDGVLQLYKSSSMRKDVTEVLLKDFTEMPFDERKKALCYPQKVTWIFAKGKSGDGSEELDMNSYLFNNALFFLKDIKIRPNRRLVLILVSSEMTDDIATAVSLTAASFSWSRIFIVFDAESTKARFVDNISSPYRDKVSQQSVVMPWKDADDNICEILDLRKLEEEKLVVTTNGTHKAVLAQHWLSWTDLDVLSLNECCEINKLNESERERKAEEAELHFYRGGQATWYNFFFERQVVERSLMPKIKETVLGFVKKPFQGKNDATIVKISHMPGTGGTTLCKNILWDLRKNYKCAVLKKISEKSTLSQVLDLWEYGENSDRKQMRNPVILLADNISDETETDYVDLLCTWLYGKQRECQLSRPLAVVISCERNVQPEKDFCLKQTLIYEDKGLMERKYRELEKKYADKSVHTFLGFLSMRNEFDKKYLLDTVKPYLQQGDLTHEEKELITYLALMMTYYPSPKKFPTVAVEYFDDLMDSGDEYFPGACQWNASLSKIAQIILIIEKEDSGTHTVRLANKVYAEAVLKAVQEIGDTLADIIRRYLKFVSSNESDFSTDVKNLMQTILIERVLVKDVRLSHMSPLIMDLEFGEAVKILRSGFECLDNKMLYCNHLGRLFLKEGKFDDAITWAAKACDLCPRSTEYKHTLGSCYMKQFDTIKIMDASNHGVDSYFKILEVAFKSFETFQKALKVQRVELQYYVNISYSFCDIFELIISIFDFVKNFVMCEKSLDSLKHWLLSEDLSDDGFDKYPSFRKLVVLRQEGMEALNFLFHLGYSQMIGQENDTEKMRRRAYAINHVREICTLEKCKSFASAVEIVVSTDDHDNAIRLKVLRNGGSFFESIFLWVEKYFRSDSERVHILQSLKQLRDYYSQIKKQHTSDMDNYVSVCLALELIGEKSDFTTNWFGLIELCNKIISKENQDDPRRIARAHLFRILLAWPRKKSKRERFSDQEFKTSFNYSCQNAHLQPANLKSCVHFFIAPAENRFHIVHWSEIFTGTSQENLKNGLTNVVPKLKIYYNGKYKETSRSGFIVINTASGNERFPLDLQIHDIRTEKRNLSETVMFHLGFSFQGPVAFIIE